MATVRGARVRRRSRVPGLRGAMVLLALGLAAPSLSVGAAGAPRGGPLPADVSGNRIDWVASLSPVAGVNVSLGLNATIALPSGAIDAGTERPVSIALSTSRNATLSFHGFGESTSFAMPVLGSTEPVAIPGANATEYGIKFQVYAALEAAISANCVTVPAGLGCPANLSWTGPSAYSLDLRAPPSVAPGGSLRLNVSNLSLRLLLNLTARGTVPYLGNVTVPIGSPTSIASVAGSPDRLSSNLTVTSPPALGSVSVTPDPVAPGGTFTVDVVATGGSGPLAFNYTGLPAGCAPDNVSQFACVAPSSGPLHFTVEVTDPQGVTASRSLDEGIGGSGGGAGFALGANRTVEIGIGIVAVAALVTTAVVLRRRARRRNPPLPRPPP